MLPKSKIRLARHLRIQTTPHPEAARWLKRGFFGLIMLLIVGIYFFARREGPTQTVAPTPKQILGEQAPKAPSYEIYQVKKGDTLFNISQNFNLSWQTLAEINNLEAPYVLKIGQEIKIPQN